MLSYAPVVFVMPTLAVEAAQIALGSSVLVSKAETLSGVSSFNITPGNSASNSGWITEYGSITSLRSSSLSQSEFILCGS